jgi:Tfp pilus assembly protein PilF
LKQCIAAERTPEQPSDITLAAWGTLGDHYLGQERFEEAKEAIWYVFDSNTRRGNPDPFYLELLLRTRFESTDPSVAIEQLQKFLDTDPNDADAHRAMGIYRARLHENDLARQHLLRALEGNSQVPRFLDAWLWFLLLTGDMEQVGQVVAQLPPACDSYPDFWVYRSKWAMHQRDWSTAIQYLERALQFEPGRLDANNLYLRCLRRTDRIQDAENVSNRESLRRLEQPQRQTSRAANLRGTEQVVQGIALGSRGGGLGSRPSEIGDAVNYRPSRLAMEAVAI